MNRPPAPRHLLPGMGGPAPLLALAFMALSLLAVLGLLAADGLARAGAARPSVQAGFITLRVAGKGLESADAAAARALELMGANPGLTDVRIDDLTLADTDGASSPRLIRARPVEDNAAAAVAIESRLRAADLEARLEPTGLAGAGVFGAAGGAVALGLGLIWLGGQGLLTAGIGRWGTRRALAGVHDRMALLIVLGAPDASLTGPVTRGVAVSAGLGAGLGALAAMAILWGLAAANVGVTGGVAPALDFRATGVAVLWPILAVAITVAASRGAARKAVESLS